MKLRKASALLLAVSLLQTPAAFGASSAAGPAGYDLDFDGSHYVLKTMKVNGKTVQYRAFERIVTVRNPVDPQYQCLNFYVPEAYYQGKSIGAFTAETAPIFFPNAVGGYMPAEAGTPGQGAGAPGMPGQPPNVSNTGADISNPNAALAALAKGYVVAAPGARGRTTQDSEGLYTGKAPAGIVDLKAAVRYLRYNDAAMPGDAERIISNGTSAGGALSALLGATGNNGDYEPYLKALGAADARDDVYAASCYCPITNLDNGDMAYEWLFSGVNDYTAMKIERVNGQMVRTPVHNTLTDAQIVHARELKQLFTPYVNSLGLTSPAGTALTLDAAGNGPFSNYVKYHMMLSAQKALDAGNDLAPLPWLTLRNGRVVDMDLAVYARSATRMKPTMAFDGADLGNGENQLFGTAVIDKQHFTAFGLARDTGGAGIADAGIVKMMNPMEYIGDSQATTAPFWRIRHGSIDRDTSLAIPVLLSAALQNQGKSVDFAFAWGKGHSGDYDLAELLAWMDEISGVPAGKPVE